MVKLDLALVNQEGDGQPVPKEMDRHMIKYFTGQRKDEVNAGKTRNDYSAFTTNRWEHSDVFYKSRTWLNQHGWDTSVYTDAVEGGAKRRKKFYDMIQEVCEKYHGVKRHQIGIYPADRATMAFNGNYYTVTFDQLRALMGQGTDVIAVEKFGTVVKMVPFTSNNGIAFIESQGFVSEYGIALARLCNGQTGKIPSDYTDGYIPKYIGHLGVLTDLDSSGVAIGLKIPGATRLGIDLDTIKEMNDANPGLDLELGDLVEATIPNSHWTRLDNLLKRKGSIYDEIRMSGTINDIFDIRDYLLQQPFKHGRVEYSEDDDVDENITLVKYLEEHRIELNTILAAAEPEAFWNWLSAKILKVWPKRDYRRAIFLEERMQTPTMTRFNEWCLDQSEPIIKDNVEKANEGKISLL
jgi:hypothetical protein